MLRLANALKIHAARLDGQVPAARYGVVQSVSPKDCTVKVLLQPENVLTGWLPVLMAGLGNGWGVVVLPSVGQQVLVLAEYGEAGSGVVAGAAFSALTQPPQVASAPGGTASYAQAGEPLLVGAGGAILRLCADGSIYMQASAVRVQGDLVVQGDVSDRHGSMNRLRENYNMHVHGGVQTGGGATGVTTLTDPQ